MSKPTYHTGDTVWYFAVDPDTDPSGWIKECEVLDDMFPLDIYTITDKRFDVPYPFNARGWQLFKTEKAAHTHFLKWAKRIHDRELAWFTKHKANK
jgi:hypothetical protein